MDRVALMEILANAFDTKDNAKLADVVDSIEAVHSASHAGPTMLPVLELPSGVMVRPDKIMVIMRHEINQYVLVTDPVLARSPIITGQDLDYLRGIGAVQALPRSEADLGHKRAGEIIEIKK